MANAGATTLLAIIASSVVVANGAATTLLTSVFTSVVLTSPNLPIPNAYFPLEYIP